MSSINQETKKVTKKSVQNIWVNLAIPMESGIHSSFHSSLLAVYLLICSHQFSKFERVSEVTASMDGL